MNGTPTVPKTSLYSGDLTMTVTRGPNVQFNAGTESDGTTAIAGITIDPAANIDGPISVTFDGTDTYTLTGTDKDGNSITNTQQLVSPATSLTFDFGGTNNTVTLDTLQFNTGDLADNVATEIGNVVPTTMNITAKTSDKSGAEVNLTGTWNWGDTSITLGDLTIPVDVDEFGALEDGDLADTRVASIAPGPGVPEKIAHLAAVKFINPDGLSQDGDSYFVETTNSGAAVATVPGNGGTGNFLSGSLEMSNVDLSREFTEMIITQRGFQANTRMITVSDEMLSELVSMKR
jgi:flagellar hook protein FlgE